ncbi:hypothetical protein COT62_03145, partial [Candidatus Roizmanbacteria bacterium CG09_land_8_20_14_0_10_41_9]
ENSPTVSTQPTISNTPSQSLFVPYWSLDGEPIAADAYDKLYYFGITPGGDSRVAQEAGFQKLDTFASSISQGKQTYLVLRMTDSETNSTILETSEQWPQLARETIDIVKKYNFSGLALDLESSNILDSGMIDKINRFVELFSSELKKENILFSFILYGDVFYRKRPFDVSHISSLTDELLVMAYDFHKSYGEPGPNFPLDGRASYGYDLKKMTEDFLKIVPSEKLTVIYGMYGYDWSVDEKKRPIKPARALTLSELRKNFIEKCEWKDCIVKRDDTSAEMEVNYVESVKSGDEYVMNLHIVWFEDEESVRRKTEYLNSKGIGSIAYWAYGYF